MGRERIFDCEFYAFVFSLSELEIEDEDCLQVRDWNLFSTKFFHCQNLISCFSSIQPPGISAPKQRLWIPVSSKVVCLSSIFYLIFDGDVIPTAPYKNTISELDIDDQDCLEVHRWKYLQTDSHDMRIVHDGKSFMTANRFSVTFLYSVQFNHEN